MLGCNATQQSTDDLRLSSGLNGARFCRIKVMGAFDMAVEFKDYYKTLGVSREATADDIRKSFRKLAREYHPDVAKDKASAEEKFKEINEAYEVLGDPEKRKKYDTLGANWNRQPPPGFDQGRGFGGRTADGQAYEFHFGGTGFSDFFEQFFGGGRAGGGIDLEEMLGGQAGRRPGSGFGNTGPMRGHDVEGDILVSIDEALNGSVRSVSLQKLNRQTGKAESTTFRVRIPVGVQEGQIIRIPGKGEEGHNGGPAGDLYLRVRFAQHPEFKVHGNSLYYQLDLAPWEAVLGTQVTIPVPTGPVTVKIPAGAANGQQLRVRGKGLPNTTGERGDLFATIHLQTPDEITPEERELWQQLADKSKFNPRK